MVPPETPESKKQATMAKEAKVEELEPVHSISQIDQYAARYGQLPRVVQQEPFDEFIPFFVLWAKQGAYYERLEVVKKRYADMEKPITPAQ